MKPRIRTVKPELFVHEGLFDLGTESGHRALIRITFIGLLCHCDREGRFKWRPRALKLGILPYDDCDFAAILAALDEAGYAKRYEVGGEKYGWVPTFRNHQIINNREMASTIPPHPADASATREARDDDTCPTPLVRAQAASSPQGELELKGREQSRTELASRTRAVGSGFTRTSLEWDQCLELMRQMDFDAGTVNRITDCGLDDLDIRRLLRDVKDNRRVRNKAGYTWGTIKKMLAEEQGRAPASWNGGGR